MACVWVKSGALCATPSVTTEKEAENKEEVHRVSHHVPRVPLPKASILATTFLTELFEERGERSFAAAEREGTVFNCLDVLRSSSFDHYTVDVNSYPSACQL